MTTGIEFELSKKIITEMIRYYRSEIRALEYENKQLRDRIYKAAKYCRPSQEIMIARVICAFLFGQENWREYDFEAELNKIKVSLND